MARRQKKHADIKIGKRLKKLRLTVGLDRKDVSDAIGYKSDNTVTCWEEGWRTIGMKGLRRLTIFFGVNLHWLQTGEGDKYDEKGGETNYAEQMATKQAMELMLKITERYTETLEARIARQIGLLKRIEKITEANEIKDIDELRYDAFLGRMRALAMTAHRIAKKALTETLDYKNHRLITLDSLRKIEGQSKEILAYLQA